MTLLERYEYLKQKVKDRKEPFDRFIKFLENETTWLASPASTRFHLSEEQGLLKHSVGVTETLLRFREFLAPAIPEESCVIVGLFHDAGKLGMPGKPLYLQNDEVFTWWRDISPSRMRNPRPLPIMTASISMTTRSLPTRRNL